MADVDPKELMRAYMKTVVSVKHAPYVMVVNGGVLNEILGEPTYDPRKAYMLHRHGDGTVTVTEVED